MDIERAQEMLDSANTGVTYKPAGEYSADEIRNIQGYLQSVDGNLLNIADNIVDNFNAQPTRIFVSEVNQNAMDAISAVAGFDASEYEFYLQKSELRHIVNRHGDTSETKSAKYHDEAMSNHSDIARMAYVLNNFDSYRQVEDTLTVFNKNRNPAKTIEFAKQVDGTYYVVAAIAEQNRYKRLWVQTCYFDDASAAKMAQKRETSSGKRHLQGRHVTSETFSPSIGPSEEGLRQASDITSPRLTSATIFPSRPSDINISQDDANVNADTGRVPGGIYANGKPLFSAMTDAELDGEIAREGRNAGRRLEEPRSERENRTGQESADRRRRDVRLGEIEQMLSDVPRADDTELNMQERYLRRRAAQLDSEIEVARDSGDDVKGLTDELRRTQDNMNAIHAEQQRRANVRQEATESLINEIRDENPGKRMDAEAERERIRQSQQAGREALDALKAERDGRRAWRRRTRIDCRRTMCASG